MIAGTCFDARRSRARPAHAEIASPGIVRVTLDEPPRDGETHHWEAPLAEVEVSERLGRVPRRLLFRDGTLFETSQNEALDRALQSVGHSTGIVHWLEARWPVAVVSLAAVALGTLLFIRVGVPAIAGYAARTLPTSVDRALGAQALEVLDEAFLNPSGLEPARQRALQARFAAMTRDDRSFAYRLELRSAPRLGPNALALPSGIVVMTDELVELAQHDDELVAVLAHEIGHVRGRHALRQLLQTAGVSAITFAILGDVSSVSAMLTAAPALIEAKHSRDFEREADAFARQWLARQGIPSHRFDDILCRMEAEHGTGSDGIGEYLSSHPATGERARCAAGSGTTGLQR